MSVQIDLSRDALFDELGLQRLRESYMREGETSPQERYAFVAESFASNPEHAQRIYDYASRHWLSFSTPVLSFGRNKRGLPVSCFLSYMPDTAEGLVNTLSEVNWLSMLGGGVGIHVGIRNADDKSVGVMPHLKVYDAACLAYRQGSTRRGSYAAFLSIDHPDIVQFIEMRKPTGDPNMRALTLHHGINISDAFMEKIEASMRDADYDDSWELKHPATGKVVETVSARDLWQRILEMRMHTGEPYLVFTDTANRVLPKWLADQGLKINGSNLCTEIFLPTNEERTAVCCLSSVNLEYFDQWKHVPQFIEDVMEFLDNVLQYFIDHAPDTISGAHIVKNRFLKRVLVELGLDTDEVWSDLIAHDGSVQHRTDLPQQVRDVFKTAQEIDQRWIIELAADRQPYIDQGQSVNLFFAPDVPIGYLHACHFMAWKKGLKSLYYCRSDKLRKADKVGQVAVRRRLEDEIDMRAVADDTGCLACEG